MSGWRAACARRAQLGECPVWDERRGELVSLDIEGREIWRVDPGVDLDVHAFEQRPCALGLCTSGHWIVAFEDEVVIYDPDRREHVRRLAAPALGAQVRFNDGKVGPDGAFYVGTMSEADPQRAEGALYRIDSSGEMAILRAGLLTSNGLAWPGDGSTLFHSDSRGPWIERRPHPLATPLRIATPDGATGRPDGATCDTEGLYWSAGVSAGVVNVFDPDGAIVRTHPTPMAGPTMPCFGGAGFATLFVTSFSAGISPSQRSAWDGALIMADGLGRGFPAWRFPNEDR